MALTILSFMCYSPFMATAKTTKKSVKKKTLWIVLAVLVGFGILYFFKNLFIVAIVNGRPISRLAFDLELEKQAGQEKGVFELLHFFEH